MYDIYTNQEKLDILVAQIPEVYYAHIIQTEQTLG